MLNALPENKICPNFVYNAQNATMQTQAKAVPDEKMDVCSDSCDENMEEDSCDDVKPAHQGVLSLVPNVVRQVGEFKVDHSTGGDNLQYSNSELEGVLPVSCSMSIKTGSLNSELIRAAKTILPNNVVIAKAQPNFKSFKGDKTFNAKKLF